MEKSKIENKSFKGEIQNKGLISPLADECPFVILQPFVHGDSGTSFAAHLTVDVELLEKLAKEQDLEAKGFIKLKDLKN